MQGRAVEAVEAASRVSGVSGVSGVSEKISGLTTEGWQHRASRQPAFSRATDAVKRRRYTAYTLRNR